MLYNALCACCCILSLLTSFSSKATVTIFAQRFTDKLAMPGNLLSDALISFSQAEQVILGTKNVVVVMIMAIKNKRLYSPIP